MTTPLRVLLIEDSVDDADLILLELRRAGFAVTSERVDTREAMTAALEKQPWDIVLSDHAMPRFNSTAALALVKEKQLDLPFLLVSGKIGEEAAVSAMRAGARDYISKDHLTRLGHAVERELREIQHARALKHLEEERLQLASIVESSDDAIIGSTLRGIIHSWNPGAERVFGYTLQEVKGQPVAILLPPEGNDTVNDVIHRIRRGHRIEHYETARVRKDGKKIHVSLTMSPIKDAEGTIVGVSTIARDITDKKMAEEALRESEERFQVVARATNDAVWDWDLLSNQIWWNEAVQKLFGYSAEQVPPDASWWIENIHAEDRDRVVRGIHALIDSGRQSWRDEYRYRCANGSYSYVFDRGYVIHDDNGQPVRMIGAMVDITERKQAEEEREKLICELKEALATIKALRGLLPICASCKKIRDDKGYWNQIETYISDHSEAQFTHGICPECVKRIYPDFYKGTAAHASEKGVPG